MSATLAAAILASTMRLVASHAYADGAPPGFSGGFKEDSCTACHFEADANTGPGRVTIDGLPARYTAGARYTLTVALTGPAMVRAGFQLTVRIADTGSQAGTLAAGGADRERVHVEISSGVQYAGQTHAGSLVSTGDTTRWAVEWTAPAAGRVIVHLSANAANGNERADGDYVYTASAEAAPDRAAPHAVSREPTSAVSRSTPAVSPSGSTAGSGARCRLRRCTSGSASRWRSCGRG